MPSLSDSPIRKSPGSRGFYDDPVAFFVTRSWAQWCFGLAALVNVLDIWAHLTVGMVEPFRVAANIALIAAGGWLFTDAEDHRRLIGLGGCATFLLLICIGLLFTGIGQVGLLLIALSLLLMGVGLAGDRQRRASGVSSPRRRD